MEKKLLSIGFTQRLGKISSCLKWLLFLTFLVSENLQAQCPISGDTLVCKGQVVSYTTAISGSYNYEWNAFGGIVTGSGTAVSVAWNTVGAGQVVLIVRDAANNLICTSVLNVTVRNNPQPVIVPSYSVACGRGRDGSDAGQGRKEEISCLTVCDSTWVTYSVQSATSSSFVWTVVGAANVIPSFGPSIQVYWTGIGSGTVKVIETDSFGCVGESEICVQIVGKPIALFTSTQPPIIGGVINICLNQTVNLNNLSVAGSGSPLNTFEWIWGDGNTTVQSAPAPFASHAYTTPGTFNLQLVAINECRCRDTFSVTVVVDSIPGPDIFCVSTVCPDQTATYYTQSVCSTYQWTVTNGAIVSGGGVLDNSITILWGTTGPGIVSLSTPNCAGTCASPTSIYVPIIPPVSSVSGPAFVCLGSTVTYKLSCSIPIDSIVWNLPQGLVPLGSTVNVHEITVQVTDSFVTGTVSAAYYHHLNGSTSGLSCGGNASLVITARPRLLLSGASAFCEGDAVTIWPFQSNFLPISGSIQWTITGVSGSPTYFVNTQVGTSPLNIAAWSYGPGLFYIEANGLSNQFCNNPQKQLIRVHPQAPLPDSIKGPRPVCPGRPYMYLAYPSASNFAIEWNVVNGSPVSSGGNTISVVWNTTGPYILQAFQIDPITGCRSQALSDTIPSMLPLATSLIAGFDTVCANYSGAIYSISDPGDLFTWSISPSIAGSVVSGQGTNTVSIDWNNWTGNATITVIRSICGQTISSTKPVHVRFPPPPNITVPSTVCQGVAASMSSTTPGISYSWNFGDGSNGSGSSTSHVFNTPGTFFVTLTITYGAGCLSTASISAPITVHPRPTVSISTPNPNIFCGLVGTVNMFVADPAVGTTYQWFQSPPPTAVGTGVSYSSNIIGNYFVVATNSFGCQTTSNSIPIDTLCDTCIHAPVTLNFSIHRQGCSKDSFSGTHSINAFNPTWYFDDIYNNPNTAVGLNPTHTFTEPGFYRIRMCVNVLASNGMDTCSVCTTQVDTIKYKPDFYYTLSCSGSGFSVNLINNTKRIATLPVPPYSWSISPGGFTSTAVNPSTNLVPGTYTATLTVDGVCVLSKPIVVPPLPSANFSIVDSVCVGTPVSYTNTSVGATGFTWYFGDGSSSLINNPFRTFSTPNIYTSKLVVSNNYGCSDSTTRTVVVMPNTLTGLITPSDTSLCEGDSILYSVTAVGGYPGYSYMWSNIQSFPSIWAKYTGSYSVDITDSKGCFFRTTPVQVLVQPVPKPEIQGPNHVCLGSNAQFAVNYPASPSYTINWLLQPNNWPGSGNSFSVGGFGLGVGTKTLYVSVTGPTGCVGFDTITFVVRNNPTATITPLAFPLCEGSNNILVGSSPSPFIVQTYWNTGWIGDTLTSSLPDNFVYTVVDSFGCSATAQLTIHPLPDFCGYQSGCYEICDTVSQLVWYAPPGHMGYQWLYNGSPIAGANSDTLHVPLYVSGVYQVQVTSWAGCVALSKETDISFVECKACVWSLKDTVVCGKLNALGQQTYNVTISLFNNLGAGAGINIVPTNGSISGLSPTTLNSGWNTITFNYLPNSNSSVHCFKLLSWLNDQRCDTLICIKLPPCDLKPCSKQLSMREIVCEGYDNAGNPIYSVCTQVVWGGPAGTQLNVGVSSGSITPSVFSLIVGSQTICYTFTDLPPYGGPSTFYFSFYDPISNESCRDSIKADHKPCPEDCKFNVYNNCAKCELVEPGFTTYILDMIIDNPFAGNASVSILPNSAGVFGAITPNPIGPGMQSIQVVFTDNAPKDTFICFTVVLTGPLGKKCTREVCMYLPPCETTGIGRKGVARVAMKLAPNPAQNNVAVFYNVIGSQKLLFELLDVTGRSLMQAEKMDGNGVIELDLQAFAAGTYFVKISSGKQTHEVQRLLIVR